jgi:Inner membrane component of T3SS, cytoplasmic domain
VSELTLTLLRLGYLALLWLLVIFVVIVLRRDIFGTKVTRRASASSPRGAVGPGGVAVSPGPLTSSRTTDVDQRTAVRSLVVTEGSLQGTTIALGQAPILLGRAPECTLVLEDDYASGRHARLYLQDGVWVVEDLGSTNGTFLGRDRVVQPTVIPPGVPVRVGRTVIELRR